LEGEWGRLRFFLSSIDLKRKERKILSAGYRCARWIVAQDDEDIYRLRGGATIMDGISKVQTVRQTVQLYEKDVTAVQRMTRVYGLVKTNRTHHQPGIASGKGY
jgi:hypothetical protein